MHRLLIATLLVCNSLVIGCKPRNQHASAAPEEPSATNVSAAQSGPARAPQNARSAAAEETTAQASPPPASPPPASAAMPNAAMPENLTSPGNPALSKSPPVASPGSDAAAAGDVASRDRTARAATPDASWSTQRLVLLARGGPRLIDLRVNVAGSDLPAGLAQQSAWLAEQLEFRFDAPISWDALLEKPLVRSGWLGNLVPSDEQRAELLAMYDKDNVGTVDAAEFQAFVTRGLTRREPIRVLEGPAAAPSQWNSPWGPLDTNEDHQLSQDELTQTAEALLHFDFDGDGIITEAETRSTSEAMANNRSMARSRGLLDLDFVLTPSAKEPTALERMVHEHYTFAEAIPRDAFFAWDNERWNKLDSKATGELTKRDLAALHDLAADAVVDARFPSSLDESAEAAQAPTGNTASAADASVSSNAQEPGSQATWTAGATGGRLLLPGCMVLVTLRDDHSRQIRELACQRFRGALGDPQLASFLASSLELHEGAWELVQQFGPSGPAQAWRWLVAPRHYHVTARWTVVEAPWFELVDADADGRLTEREISGFSPAARTWDRNLDGTLDADELPLVIAVAVSREDSRLANLSAGGMNIEKGGASATTGPSWFSAMDYNSDGGVTHAEFLGAESVFETLDANGDGIIDVREVYAPH